MHPRIPLAARAHCWLTVNLSSTSTPRSLSAQLLSSRSAPSLYWYMTLFLPRCRTLHLPLLSLIRFLSAQLSACPGHAEWQHSLLFFFLPLITAFKSHWFELFLRVGEIMFLLKAYLDLFLHWLCLFHITWVSGKVEGCSLSAHCSPCLLAKWAGDAPLGRNTPSKNAFEGCFWSVSPWKL